MNRRSVYLSRFSLVASVVLSGFFAGGGVDAFTAATAGAALQNVKLFSATQQQQYAPATTASPLAEHGDWQAFFDDDRYCLVYYFNTVTGTSQWEPPDNFPIPAVRHHQQSKPASIAVTGIEQHVNGKKTEEWRVHTAKKAEKKEEQGAFQWFVKGAFQAASDLIEKQQEQEAAKKKKPAKDSKPWWSFLVDGDDTSSSETTAKPVGTHEVVRHAPKARPSQPKEQKKEKQPSFWDRLFSSSKTEKEQDVSSNRSARANGHQVQQQEHSSSRGPQPSMGTTLQQQHTEWLKFMDDDSSPTFPLVPPSEREAKLQQKLYADSLARQENLRRNYKAVQEHRSRTFSLSALKRGNPQAKEWHQFLDD